MRRTRLCWRSLSLAVGWESVKASLVARQESVKTSATCVWARGRSLPTGHRYLAGSQCDVLSVLDPVGKHHLLVESITPLSTVSVRTATVSGPNGRGEADREGHAQVESLRRQRIFSKNTLPAQVSQNQNASLQAREYQNLRHLQARMLLGLHGPVLSPQKVDQERVVAPKVIHRNKHQILVRHRKGVEGRAHQNLRHLQARMHLLLLRLLRGTLLVLKAAVEVCMEPLHSLSQSWWWL